MKAQFLTCHYIKTWCFNFFVFEDLATHCIKWFPFRIHNEAKHNNAILTKTKNVVVVSDVATKADLIKSKKIKTEKTSVLMNVTADDKVNLNRFERRWSDRWYLKDMNTQNRHEKKIRKLNVYWYCFIRRITIYQDFETDLINKI